MARKTKAELKLIAAAKEKELNTTRDGILVEAGQIWNDCNPRAKNRNVSVNSVTAGIATVFDGKRTTELAVTRMWPHSRGYKSWM